MSEPSMTHRLVQSVRGWWLVAAIIAATLAPTVGLIWTRSTWYTVLIGVWVYAALRTGGRLIERDFEREGNATNGSGETT